MKILKHLTNSIIFFLLLIDPTNKNLYELVIEDLCVYLVSSIKLGTIKTR